MQSYAAPFAQSSTTFRPSSRTPAVPCTKSMYSRTYSLRRLMRPMFSRLARGEKKYVRLDMERVNRIHLTGGCILQMSRYNPTKKESDLRTVVDTLTELGVTHVVTIGGDDTAYSAMAVSNYARHRHRSSRRA